MSATDRHAALAVPVRARMLDRLRTADSPVTARDLAGEVGLHVTTVRFHLDVLQRAELVRADLGPAVGRGRPPLRYRAADTGADFVQAQMIEVLADALADRSSRDRPRTAGRRWAERLPRGTGDPQVALLDGLSTLGFAPQAASDGIRLHQCPFGDAARRHPDVVCRIHLGLAEGIAESAADGEAVPAVELVPFAGPDTCLLTVQAAGTRGG